MILLKFFFSKLKYKSILVLIFILLPIISLSNPEIYLNYYKNKKIISTLSDSEISGSKNPDSYEIPSTIKYSTSEQTNISYLNQQKFQTNITSKNLIPFNSSITSDIVIESTPFFSEFYLNSDVSSNETIWRNGQEEGYGDVNISEQLSDEIPYYRFNFSETPSSGISNMNYNRTPIPIPYNHSTVLSFEFKIPWIDINLLNNTHSLVLELRFNNASINFLFSDNGSSLGEPLEPNVFKPSTNSLYILCNQSITSDWNQFTYNITNLIISHFSPQSFSYFDTMITLFCYMFAFIPDYSIALDLRNLDYNTSLSGKVPATYNISGSPIYSSNGSLKYGFEGENVTLIISENTSWKNNQITYFNFTITRQTELISFPRFHSVNTTYLEVNLPISYPYSILQCNNSRVIISLPIDWDNITFLNSSVFLEKRDQLNLYSGLLDGYKYELFLQNNTQIILRALVINYITYVNFPTDISYNNSFQVTGNLLTPLPGALHLYIYNQTVYLHQTTLPMLNGSFIFPLTSISDELPSGIVKILINWSSVYEYGIYENLLCIHPLESDLSTIDLFTPSDLVFYQYDAFYVNLSLLKNGINYVSESTNVYLVINNYFYFFTRIHGSNYSLLINHLIWDAGFYNGTIIASDGINYYASNIITITVYSATIDSRTENFPSLIYRETDLNFRLHTFAGPTEGGTNWPIPNVGFTVWINDTKITEGFTNSQGYSDIFISNSLFNQSFSMIVTILSELEEKTIGLESYNVQISNDSLVLGRQISVLTKISQTPIISNSTYYKIFNVLYPKNTSQWYTVLEGVDSNPISAHLLRDDYALEITIVDSLLIWNILGNTTDNDIIVLEYTGPVTHYTIYEEIRKYSIHIECYSNYTISNYTFQIDLSFIEFSLSTISLLDFLKHDITGKFDIEIKESKVSLRNLSILSGIKTNYYLEVGIIIPTVEILEGFRPSYSYNEEIVGKWKFSSGGSFTYSVYFSVTGSFRSECMNTTLIVYPNDTCIVEAFLPSLKWNSTVSVNMELVLSRGAVSKCPSQNYTVTDPYSPDLTYFLEYKKHIIDLHLFPFEPELGSGIENISVWYHGTKFNINNISDNHFHIEFSRNIIDSGNISVIITDKAGNINISNIMLEDVNRVFDEELPLISFFPSLAAFIVTTGYLLSKFLKRRKNQLI